VLSLELPDELNFIVVVVVKESRQLMRISPGGLLTEVPDNAIVMSRLQTGWSPPLSL
jgi:hypothetical protein